MLVCRRWHSGLELLWHACDACGGVAGCCCSCAPDPLAEAAAGAELDRILGD